MLFFVFPGLEVVLPYCPNINTIPPKLLVATGFTIIAYMANQKELKNSILRVFSIRSRIAVLSQYKYSDS